MTTITPNTENQLYSLLQDMPNPFNITIYLNTIKSQSGPILDDF